MDSEIVLPHPLQVTPGSKEEEAWIQRRRKSSKKVDEEYIEELILDGGYGAHAWSYMRMGKWHDVRKTAQDALLVVLGKVGVVEEGPIVHLTAGGEFLKFRMRIVRE